MKLSTAVISLLAPHLTAYVHADTHHKRNYDAHDYYAVELQPGMKPEDVSAHLDLVYEGPLGRLPDHHMFRANGKVHEYDHIKTALSDLKARRKRRDVGQETHILDSIKFTQKQELHKRFPLVKRSIPPALRNGDWSPVVQKGLDIAQSLEISDPIYGDQWHLFNSQQPGHDINVTGVWMQGIIGRNSTVVIVDDGLDMDSEDLKENYFAEGSHDFNDDNPVPKPRLSDDRHGTRCAGEVAAVKNNVCGIGVAWGAKVAGERILSKTISDSDEAAAMNWAFDSNDIYSCSWGPPDDGQSMEAPGILIRRAMVNGIQNGRGKLGSIYVFAIGNGAANDDNCNFDGYTNSIYSVSVGGIDRKGLHPYYSEACSAQLVVTYSSGSGDAIHTTDVGANKCYTSHGGTSAAGPLVAGIYALMLEVNKNLSWRDIQWITVLTAVKVNQPSDWYPNRAVGKDYSHQFGYGKTDAYAMVEMAKDWRSVKPQAWYFSPWQHVKHAIPQGEDGLASYIEVTKEMLQEANLERVEHVTVTMNVEHARRGDMSVELHSPSGMVSHIATHRRNDDSDAGYKDWTFMSVAHWGERGIGNWTVVVKDTLVNDKSGNFTDWRIKLWGECRDARSQGLLPMPNENDDEDHDREDASFVTTSVSVPTQTGDPAGNPTDHIDRPVNSKPSETEAETTATPTPTDQPVEDSKEGEADKKPEQEQEKEHEHEAEHEAEDNLPATPTPTPSNTSPASNFLPHPFPSFGVSKKTQIWIYGAFVLIVIFLIALGSYLYYMKRRKAWMSRDQYGFEMVETEDQDEARGVAAQDVYGKGRKKRAGELYDAFAEGTDDEFELAGDSDDEGEDGKEHVAGAESERDAAARYRDDEPLREGLDVR